MKTNSSNGNKFQNKENTLFGKLDKKRINSIARFTGFTKRKTDKIKPLFLIFGFYKMMTKNLNTYEDWSSEIALLSGKSLSRQAVEERMTVETANMTRLIFEEKMHSLLSKQVPLKDKTVLKKFKTILIDDSTILSLPEQLNQSFPGNVVSGKKKAQIKIHALYNFTHNSFSFLNIHNYTDSDQGLAGNVLPHLKSGDLILRDLGFQNLSTQKALIHKQVYFVAKKSPAVKIYDIKTGKEFFLFKYLKKKRFFDGEVLVGKTERIQMRLVIRPLSKEVVAERRRKAKTNRNRRCNYSKEYYELLGYSILLTNIVKEMCSFQQIGELYGLRWRIETIFKSWKSNFTLEKILPKRCNNPERIYCIIYMMLLLIILFQSVWLKNVNLKSEKSYLSLLKLSKFFKQHFISIMEGKHNEKILKQAEKQCKYDIRHEKENTMEKYYKHAA